MAGSTINVQQPVGTAWLIINYESVLFWALLSLLPIYYLYRRYRTSSERARALFDFTLAESLRRGEGGALRGDPLTIYDSILARAASEHLVWRTHAGRAQVLAKRGQTTEALQAATKAIELAQVELKKREAAAAKKGKAGVEEVDESELGPDVDPFLHAPISLALLHYQRGLISDARKEFDLANADYALACAMDEDRSFLEGYVARRQFEERLAHGKPVTKSEVKESKEEGESSSSSTAAESGVVKQRPTTTAGSTNPTLAAATSPKNKPEKTKTKASPNKTN